jgi:hypothetical protein
MSRIGDYVIGEQEEGRMDIPDPVDPHIPERDEAIKLEDNIPIPPTMRERSDLNSRFGNLPFGRMQVGQSFALTDMSEKEYTALRARVSRANKKHDGRFSLQTENRTENGISGRIFRVQ